MLMPLQLLLIWAHPVTVLQPWLPLGVTMVILKIQELVSLNTFILLRDNSIRILISKFVQQKQTKMFIRNFECTDCWLRSVD